MEDRKVLLRRTCFICREETQLHLDAKRWRQYANGALVQDVWPELDADDREMIVSGTHAWCWPQDEEE